METPAQKFTREVEEFLARSGMKPTTFGWVALKDRNFVGDLRTGRAPSLRLVHRVQTFIREQEGVA